MNYPGETPVISGGVPVGKGGLGLTWKHESGALWQVQLPANTEPFEYFFYQWRAAAASACAIGRGRRILHARRRLRFHRD
jgi:hypothetical protein